MPPSPPQIGELVAESGDPVADLDRARLELHQPDVLGRRTDPAHDLRPEPDAEVRRCVLDHDGDRHRGRHADEVVDEGRLADRRRPWGAGRTMQLAPACSAWRASSIEARMLGAPAPTKTGTAPADLVDDHVGEGAALVGGELQHLAGEPERDDAVRAAVEREAHDAPLRVEVHVAVRRERRADRGIHPAPRC